MSKTEAVGSAKRIKILELRYAPDYFVQLRFSDSGTVTARDSTWFTETKAEVFQLIGSSMINTHHCMSAQDTCYCTKAEPNFINLWLTYENGRAIQTHFIDKPYDELNFWRDMETTELPRRASVPFRAPDGLIYRPDGRVYGDAIGPDPIPIFRR